MPRWKVASVLSTVPVSWFWKKSFLGLQDQRVQKLCTGNPTNDISTPNSTELTNELHHEMHAEHSTSLQVRLVVRLSTQHRRRKWRFILQGQCDPSAYYAPVLEPGQDLYEGPWRLATQHMFSQSLHSLQDIAEAHAPPTHHRMCVSAWYRSFLRNHTNFWHINICIIHSLPNVTILFTCSSTNCSTC
jgi:hypothetical protein